ncbi:MAG: HNH endonuclease, partial [Acidimicrobiales bacterium]|nr:HNH endonuclease [Acidimicrobiales bacterium]
MIDLAGRLSVGTYELLVLVGEIDARGSFVTWGALTCAAWLADVCRIEVCTARTQVRVARAMREF